MRVGLLWLVLCFCRLAYAAPAVATVTLLEGDASLLRGVSRYVLAEGVKLQPGDIVELADKGWAQFELANGVIVLLGPQSRWFYFPSDKGKSGAGAFFLLQGVLKASASSAGPVFAMERATVPLLNATVVLQSSADGEAVFVERGEATIEEKEGSAVNRLQLKSGQFYSRSADQRGVVEPRPSPSFIAALPKAFLDTPPSRLERDKDKDVAPEKTADFTYADVAPWLDSGSPAVRKALALRWRPKARDPAFRAALVENLKQHPEWEPILYPPKTHCRTRASCGRPSHAP